MNTSVRATIAHELLQEIGHYLTALEKPTQFRLKQLEREAAKLATHDAAAAALARASIFALQWDVEAMHAQLRNLCHLDRGLEPLLNAAVLCSKVNDMGAGLLFARRAFDLAPTSQKAADALMKALLQSGYLREVRRILPTLPALSDIVREACSVDPIISMLEVLGVTDARLQHELGVGYAVLRRAQARVFQSRYVNETDPEDGALSVSYELTIDCGPEAEEALAADLVDGLMDAPSWNPAEFTIDFVPLRPVFDELHAA